MIQRHVCPSMGAIRRSIPRQVATASNASSRAFAQSARRCDEGESNSDTKTSLKDAMTTAPRQTLRTRSNAAFRKLSSLPSDSRGAGQPGQSPVGGSLIRRVVEDRVQPSRSRPNPPGGPAGTLIRAPAKLRIQPAGSQAVSGPQGSRGPPGPNLRGRAPGGPPGRAQGGMRGENGPRKRDRTQTAKPAKKPFDDSIESKLNDGMVLNLLRLQRNEWDRTPYEPQYGAESDKAKELIERGKKLFEGEKPKPKVREWGKLERTIGIVGMHGA